MALDLSQLDRIGQGRAAEVFALDAKRVLKVARPDNSPAIDREAAALRIGTPPTCRYQLRTTCDE